MKSKIYKVLGVLVVLFLIIVISLISLNPVGKSYKVTLRPNEKQEIRFVSSGNYIELVSIDLEKRDAIFLVYDKSATTESQKYRFTIKEGYSQGVSVAHCELIDVSVLKIESSGVNVDVKRNSDCVF